VAGEEIMSAPALALPRSAGRVAVLVMMVTDGASALCPFFGKCDGFLVIDRASDVREFYPNEDRTADSLCDLIVKSGAGQLVCGFIPEPAKRRLRSGGIDIRLGACTLSVEELVQSASEFPEA
jgi:predicted Fe-Mo cluster-binding NifX family protein